MPQFRVDYNSNNSGGDWWLGDEDWDNLQKAGWTVAWYRPKRFLGALASRAEKVFGAEDESGAVDAAEEEFRRITGQDPEDEGCRCCGRPHSFYATTVKEG